MSSSILSSDILSLKLLKPEDVSQDYVNWLNDSETNRYLESRNTLQSMSSVIKFVELSVANEKEFLFGVFKNKNMEHIGNIRLHEINKKDKTGEIGLLIGQKASWGMGFGSKSIFLVSRFAFKKLKLEEVLAGCCETNIGSIKAFEKCGFKIVSCLKNQVQVEDEYKDVFRLSCNSSELINVV